MLLAVVLTVACSAPSPQYFASSSQPIVSGIDDDADGAVVALLGGGTPYCSGTLIAPRAVLTAAHCVRDDAPTVVSFDASTERAERVVAVTRTIRHPSFDPATLDNDIAVLVLATASDVSPATPFDGSFAALVGNDVRIVGFGFGVNGSDAAAWRRRKGSARVASLDAHTIELHADPSLPCVGDSGGPTFAMTTDGARLVGVTSHGDRDCGAFAVDVRVDVYKESFIAPAIAIAAAAAPDARSGSGCSAGARSSGGGRALAFVAALVASVRRRRIVPRPTASNVGVPRCPA